MNDDAQAALIIDLPYALMSSPSGWQLVGGILLVFIEVGYVLLKNFAIFIFMAGCLAKLGICRWFWRLNG